METLLIILGIVGVLYLLGRASAAKKKGADGSVNNQPSAPSARVYNDSHASSGLPKPCPDEMCLGYIAADGECSVCGKQSSRSRNNPSAKPTRPIASTTKYLTNTIERTCSCPDWMEKRSGFSLGEPMRLCKHLVKAVADAGLAGEYGSEEDDIIRFSQMGMGYYPSRDREYAGDNEDLQTRQGRLVMLRHLFGRGVAERHVAAIEKAFGGQGYIYNLSMFDSRVAKGAVTLHVPKGDYYRWRFETLARTGVARRGTALSTAEVLEGLKMADIRALANHLPGPIKFKSKKEGCEKIAAFGGQVLASLPGGLRVEDFFRLEPLALDEILKRWGD